MDIADHAAQAEQEFLARALELVRRQAPHGAAAFWCDECDERIPAARRRAIAGVRLCVECQTLREQRKR